MIVLALLVACRPGTPLQEAAVEAGVDWPLQDVRLAIDKSERRMELLEGTAVVRSYRVGLGPAPEGDKEREGDMRTPIGELRVVVRNSRSSFHRFLGLSYPDSRAADRGLATGLIDEDEAQAIREADREGRQPPWDTALGGEVGIHGGGSARDWTHGCIAVEDAEIAELWEVVPLGTPVVISE